MSESTAGEPKPVAKPNPYRDLVTNPASRTYLMVAAGGLVVSLLTMFLVGSPIAAILLLLVGLCGLVLRWTAMPVFYVLLLGYFLFAPLGLPLELSSFSEIPGSHFRFLDAVLIGSSLVYLIAQYRLLSVIHIGMPFDAAKHFVKPGAKATVRPAESPRDRELWMLFGRAGLFVLAGQLFWLAITYLRVDLEKFPPVAIQTPTDGYRRYGMSDDDLYIPEPFSRFLLAVAFFFAVALAARFAFWYWGLLQLQRDQARMILLDAHWADARGELSRQEKWRSWQKGKILGKAREKFGCGGWFLALGLPILLLVFFFIVLYCCGGFR